jgi:hypothetical protein
MVFKFWFIITNRKKEFKKGVFFAHHETIELLEA